jgi:hypothetical protein
MVPPSSKCLSLLSLSDPCDLIARGAGVGCGRAEGGVGDWRLRGTGPYRPYFPLFSLPHHSTRTKTKHIQTSNAVLFLGCLLHRCTRKPATTDCCLLTGSNIRSPCPGHHAHTAAAIGPAPRKERVEEVSQQVR